MHHPAGLMSCTKWRNRNAHYGQRGSTTAQFDRMYCSSSFPCLCIFASIDFRQILLVYSCIEGCRFFIRESEEIGLGITDTQTCDILAVLVGGNVPYVLEFNNFNSTRLNVISLANAISNRLSHLPRLNGHNPRRYTFATAVLT